MILPPETQIDLFAWARELEQERERVADANAERAARRGYLVFATDPGIAPEQSGYREVYATEARTRTKRWPRSSRSPKAAASGPTWPPAVTATSWPRLAGSPNSSPPTWSSRLAGPRTSTHNPETSSSRSPRLRIHPRRRPLLHLASNLSIVSRAPARASRGSRSVTMPRFHRLVVDGHSPGRADLLLAPVALANRAAGVELGRYPLA